jgi:hypothetical protein
MFRITGAHRLVGVLEDEEMRRLEDAGAELVLLFGDWMPVPMLPQPPIGRLGEAKSRSGPPET